MALLNECVVQIVNCKVIGKSDSQEERNIESCAGIWYVPPDEAKHEFYCVGDCVSENCLAYICQCGLAFRNASGVLKHQNYFQKKVEAKPPKVEYKMSIEQCSILEYIRRNYKVVYADHNHLAGELKVRLNQVTTFLKKRKSEDVKGSYSWLNGKLTPEVIEKAKDVWENVQQLKKAKSRKLGRPRKKVATKMTSSADANDKTTELSEANNCTTQSPSLTTADTTGSFNENGTEHNNPIADDCTDEVCILFEGPSSSNSLKLKSDAYKNVADFNKLSRSTKINVLKALRRKRVVTPKYYKPIAQLLGLDLLTVKVNLKYSIPSDLTESKADVEGLATVLWDRVVKRVN